MSETYFEVHVRHLKVLVKWVMIHEVLWILKFILSIGKLFLAVFFLQLFKFLALRKWKSTVKYLKLFWYIVFVHLKLKFLDFPSDFVVKTICRTACIAGVSFLFWFCRWRKRQKKRKDFRHFAGLKYNILLKTGMIALHSN